MELLGSLGVIHKEELKRGLHIVQMEREKIYHLIVFVLESTEKRNGWFLAYVLILPTYTFVFHCLGNFC